VANAAEHGDGQPIGFALRRLPRSRGAQGLMCEVTDTSPALPVARHVGPDAERGRGLSLPSPGPAESRPARRRATRPPEPSRSAAHRDAASPLAPVAP